MDEWLFRETTNFAEMPKFLGLELTVITSHQHDDASFIWMIANLSMSSRLRDDIQVLNCSLNFATTFSVSCVLRCLFKKILSWVLNSFGSSIFPTVVSCLTDKWSLLPSTIRWSRNRDVSANVFPLKTSLCCATGILSFAEISLFNKAISSLSET